LPVTLMIGVMDVAAVGAVGVDRPTLFVQGTIVVLALASVLVMAESSRGMGALTGQAAALPGSAGEREGLLAGISHAEVYPLTLFAGFRLHCPWRRAGLLPAGKLQGLRYTKQA
ncbi:MAG: hypothetical protein ACRDRJ_37120, partial [Streptosporangiaceae bacterium]